VRVVRIVLLKCLCVRALRLETLKFGCGLRFDVPRGTFPGLKSSFRIAITSEHPNDTADKLTLALQRKGAKDVDPQKVYDLLNMSWCDRPGINCIQKIRRDRKPVEQTPSVWGSAAWKMLAMFGVEGSEPDTQGFWETVEIVRRFLNPSRNPLTGCESCHNHFNEFIRNNPSDDVLTVKQIAKWVFEAHNAASANAGKKQMSYDEAALLHNWPRE